MIKKKKPEVLGPVSGSLRERKTKRENEYGKVIIKKKK